MQLEPCNIGALQVEHTSLAAYAQLKTNHDINTPLKDSNAIFGDRMSSPTNLCSGTLI